MDEESRRQWHRLWLIIAVVGAIPFVLLGIHVILNRHGIARRLRALRAAGLPTDLTEWAEAHKLPDGKANAAEIYERSFALFIDPSQDANVPIVGWENLPDRGVTWSQPMLDDVNQYLQDNQACLALLHEACGIGQCRYNWQYVPDLPDIAGVRNGARLLQLEMVFRAQQGDGVGANSSLESLLRLANSVQHEPTLIIYLVRIACLSRVLRGLEWTLSPTSFTDRQLGELDRMLAETAETLDLTEAMVSERCWAIEIFRDPSLMANNMIGGGGFVLRLPGVVTMGLVDALDYIADIIEALELPPVERLSRKSSRFGTS